MNEEDTEQKIAECKTRVVKVILHNLRIPFPTVSIDSGNRKQDTKNFGGVSSILDKSTTVRNYRLRERKSSQRYADYICDDDDDEDEASCHDNNSNSDCYKPSKSKKAKIPTPTAAQIKTQPKLKPPQENTKSRYKCEICLKIYARTNSLLNHQKRHAITDTVVSNGKPNQNNSNCSDSDSTETTPTITVPIPKFIQCELCSNKFKDVDRLETHILEYHVVDKPHECEICFKTFINEPLYNRHISRHRRRAAFKCSLCPALSFKTKQCLSAHMKREHTANTKTSKRPFYCPVCYTFFTSDLELSNHLKTGSTNSARNCTICTETNTDKNSTIYENQCLLNLHYRQKHKGQLSDQGNYKEQNHLMSMEPDDAKSKTFSCVVCKESFKRRSDLNFHEKQQQHRRWTCPIPNCGKVLLQKKYLQGHIRAVHSDAKPYKCDDCEQSFKIVRNLRRHQMTHVPEQDRMKKLKYVCVDCSQFFGKKDELLLHRAGHHGGEKPFQCQFCPKKWATKASLKQHLFKHTDETPFPCDRENCDRAFKCVRALNVHIKARHGSVNKVRVQKVKKVAVRVAKTATTDSTKTKKVGIKEASNPIKLEIKEENPDALVQHRQENFEMNIKEENIYRYCCKSRD